MINKDEGFIVSTIALIVAISSTMISFIVKAFIWGVLLYWAYNPLAPKWLYFIPQNFQVIGFWESIGLVILIGVVGKFIDALVPKLVSK